MNISAAFNVLGNTIYQQPTQPKSPAASAAKPEYHGTQEQADAVAKQDTMVRKYHRPLGGRQW